MSSRLPLAIGVVVQLLFAGCATPQIGDLRTMPPNANFVVRADVGCLYQAGVEHASSYLGQTEPKFVWHKDASGQAAWFRQPLTLIDLRAVAVGATDVRRHQTSSAAALGQGDDLLAFLRANPCEGRPK